MHPTTARSTRSTLQSPIPSATTPSSLLHPAQQQQILYGPITNPMVTLQPCGTGLYPSCIYPGPQRNPGLPNPVPLQIQGKNSRWPSKNKVVRGQQHYCQQQQQQHIQQQLSYNPKPLVLFDQTANNAAAPPTPTTSFLVASSTFTHGSFSGDQYNSSGVTLIPQPYFKPPDVQTFCLVQDRQAAQQQQQQQPQPQQEQPPHGSYYNISATNTCSLQTVNANSAVQFSNLGPYASVATFTNNQISGPVQTVQSAQIFPNPPVNLVFGGPQREKPSPLPAIDISSLKCPRNKVTTVNVPQATSVSESYNEWPSQVIASLSNSLFDLKLTSDDVNPTTADDLQKSVPNVSAKTQEEHYSDESSASFDFTIEAEKMVSALCNTTSSNDLAKEETRNNKSNSEPLFSGAGDTVSNKNSWFTDFCVDYETGTSIAVQTDGPCLDRSQYSELIRKAVYWGCTEAEIVLNNNTKTDSRCSWLKNLTSATKTAITKSSTCFPIFAGDHIFVDDLINALLRISNGWLVLDNYLNKQHYPSLNNKYDQELNRCFQMWEESTHELLNQIVKTFLKLEKNSDVSNYDKKTESPGTSFPGDVSLYANFDLLNPSTCTNTLRQETSDKKNSQETSFNATRFTSPQPSTGNLRKFPLYDTSQQKQSGQKESKLRSKWTVTENLTSTVDSTKSVPDMFLGHAEAGVQSSGRFRARGSSSSTRIDTSTQSLNAEFFHLRSKVLEGNHDTCRQWIFKDQKQEFVEDRIPSVSENTEPIFRLQRPMTDGNCENIYAQKCPSRIESSFTNPSNLKTMYLSSNTDGHLEHNYSVYSPYIDYGNKNTKSFDPHHANKPSNVDLIYVGKSTNQLELAAVPKNKITLLSQIEPSVPDKSSEEMTANLSAWFASMRNTDSRQMPIANLGETRTENFVARLSSRQEMSKATMDLTRQLQIDANRQLQTLQNMQSIQSAPWNANNLINNRQVHQVPEEYDSSEDVRVYMKPGSYNVPKKRHQRRSNRRVDNSIPRNTATGTGGGHRNHYPNKEKIFSTPASSTPVPRSTISPACSTVNTSTTMKLPFPMTPIVPSPTFSLENSPRILKRSDPTNYETQQDVTWKAACASAEILLEALNVKDDSETKDCKNIGRGNNGNNDSTENINSDAVLQLLHSQKTAQENFSKTLKHCDDGCGGASSYEASEDDSGSTYRLSPNPSINEISQSSENKNGFSKTNVKTDSWLIRTLNNASIVSKQKQRKPNNDQNSSESSNSSMIEDDQVITSLSTIGVATTIATTTTIQNFQQTTCSQESLYASYNNDQMVTEESERIVGKATYSETVRRCTPINATSEKKECCKKSKLSVASMSTICGTVVPIPGRRCQRKDPERSYHLLHKSRKSSAKKAVKTNDIIEPLIEEGSSSVKTKVTRNESTTSCAASKSAAPTKHGKKKDNVVACAEFIEGKFGGKTSDRGWSVWYSSKRKQSLSPLALSKLEMIHQTVWQMEEAQILKCPSSRGNNSSQSSTGTNDHDRVRMIESLSKKLEELFEEHFASWDFDNISGSPREGSPVSHRFKSTGPKPVAGRHGNTKKSPSSVIAESA